MKGQILVTFVLCAALSVVFATPLQQNLLQPNYDNVPRCFQPAVTGMCLAYFPSYYYSSSHKTCKEFIYGGCGGNQNRFVTFEACMAACEGAEPEEQDFKLILPSESIDICKLPQKTGSCRAGIPRFYFSGDECKEFLYGGCEGNENNFETLEECQQKCIVESSEESEENETAPENKSSEESAEQPNSEEAKKDE